MNNNILGRKALIVGATGLIGGYCLQGLLDSTHYSEVTALVRKPLKAKHHKLKEVITNFDDLQGLLSTVKVDDVFCCLGTTIKKAGSKEGFKKIDYELVISIAKLLQENGAEQYLVISAMGANKDSKVFYNRVKGEMEDTLQHLGYPCVRILRPSLLLGPRKEFRFGEKVGVILTPILKYFLVGGMKKYTPIEAESVARFMTNVACEEPISGNHIYESDLFGK